MDTANIFAKIRKRNGEIVDFDRNRIEKAIEKACIAEGFPGAARRIPSITDAVIASLIAAFGSRTPSVEDVQDIVERKLAEGGLFEVAKAYILYRKDHAASRAAEKADSLHKIEERKLMVKKADGTLVPFDPLAVESSLEFLAREYGTAIDRPGIVRDTVMAVFDGISDDEADKALIMAVRARIELDPA